MAAPKGNQFWKLRSKHGRDLLFSTPELLWEAACEYFEHTDNRTWIKKDWVGKDAKEVNRESTPPYTLRGFLLYIGANLSYWSEFKTAKAANLNGFPEIIHAIEEIIYNQKFEGAAVGAFNANIIARDLGLREQSEINLNDAREKVGELFPDMEQYGQTNKS